MRLLRDFRGSSGDTFQRCLSRTRIGVKLRCVSVPVILWMVEIRLMFALRGAHRIGSPPIFCQNFGDTLFPATVHLSALGCKFP